MKRRCFGEVWLGRQHNASNYVAIKRVKNKEGTSVIEANAEFFKSCPSSFIVKYYDVKWIGAELWVRLFPMWINCSWWRSTVVEALLVIT